ncbi:MAG: hypothetical protein PF572_01460 [Patescibacteria group bacterium]|jgi:hypothetical protein|nr:hypothetical protein [Patescibacteria group bacterium]
MKIGDKVVFKQEIIDRCERAGNNPAMKPDSKAEMEIVEVKKSIILVRSGACIIRVNPSAIEPA